MSRRIATDAWLGLFGGLARLPGALFDAALGKSTFFLSLDRLGLLLIKRSIGDARTTGAYQSKAGAAKGTVTDTRNKGIPPATTGRSTYLTIGMLSEQLPKQIQRGCRFGNALQA